MKHIIFIGDVALDEYYKAEYFPQIKEKISVETLPAQTGGMIANAAAVYASYTDGVEFCGVLNSGPVSKMLCEDLNSSNVGTRFVMTDNRLADSKVIIILAEDEHTVFIPNINVTEIPLTDEAYYALLQADWVYSNIHEIKFLKYKEKDAHAIIREMKANGCQFAFDLDVADFRPGEREFIKYIDYIFVNEIGFENLKKELGDAAGIDSLFASGAKLLVKTLAENGAEIIQAGKTIAIPGHTVDVVDVTGAGDTFCSTFVYMLSKTDDCQLAGEFANYAAARSVTGLGARYGAAGIEEVLQFIKQQGGDTEQFVFETDSEA